MSVSPQQIAARSLTRRNQQGSKLDRVREACRRSIVYFSRAVMPNIFSLPSPDFHHQLERSILSEDPHINIMAPRGFAKTTITAIGGAMHHVFAKEGPTGADGSRKPRFVLLISKSRPHSINLLTTIKNVLEYSRPFHALYGYHGAQNAKVWREDFVILDTGDIFVCRGMRTPVRGLNIHGVRPTYIVLDDAEDEENTKTAERMEANYAWFINAVVPSGQAGDCKIVNIGTPQHQRALVFRLKEQNDWVTEHYAAIVRDKETGEEESLWPELRSLAWLQERRDSLEEAGRLSYFYREYMCEVIGDADHIFSPHQFTKKWSPREDEEPVEIDAMGKHWLRVAGQENPIGVTLFMGVDPASSLSATADYTAIVVIAVDKHKNRWVIDVVRRRMKPLAVAKEIERMYKKYRPCKTQVETVGYQSMIGDYIRERGLSIPGLQIQNHPRRGKTERIEGLQPIFEQGQVIWPTRKHLPVIEDMIDEFLLFPRGAHDDCCDAFYYANKGAYRPYHEAADRPKVLEGVPVGRKTYDWKVE